MNEERRRGWRLLVDFLVSRDLANDCRKRKEGKKEIRKRVSAPSGSTMLASISRTGGPRNGGVFNTRGCEVG